MKSIRLVVMAADLLQTRGKIKLLAGLLLTVLLMVSCNQETPRTQRLIILGFDGMDPVLARKWMDDGSLPNFRKLATMGEFHALPTSNPPQSPVAWSDFATGTGPGEHGIYDFLRRDPKTYLPDFSISRVIPPQSFLPLFGMELPLEDGEIINRRIGTPFWSAVEETRWPVHGLKGACYFSTRSHPPYDGRYGCTRSAGYPGYLYDLLHPAVSKL